jgi:hypothetical protein
VPATTGPAVHDDHAPKNTDLTVLVIVPAFSVAGDDPITNVNWVAEITDATVNVPLKFVVPVITTELPTATVCAAEVVAVAMLDVAEIVVIVDVCV